MNVTITEPKASDKTQWQQQYQHYADFYQRPITDDILNSVWSWIMDTSQPFYALIAKNDKNEIVGFMHYRQMPSPLRGQMIGFLDDLFVHHSCRGQGAASALFAALNNKGKEHNWALIRWITAEDNITARSLYDKLANKTQWLTYEMSIG